MKLDLSVPRIAAVVVMGILFGSYNYHNYTTWNLRGRDAFLSHELERFNKYMAHPHSILFTLTAATIACAFIFGFYELIAVAFLKLLPSKAAVQASTPIHVP